MGTPTYQPLATLTLSSSAASVTFSSISQAYRDLVLVVAIASDSNGVPNVVFNGDTSSSYSYVYAVGDGSSTGSASGTGTSLAFAGNVWTNTTFSHNASMQIMDYSATNKHKSTLHRANNTSTALLIGSAMVAGRWANTAAITTILIQSGGVNFLAGSTFALYGIAA